jgi:hypothetical protein
MQARCHSRVVRLRKRSVKLRTLPTCHCWRGFFSAPSGRTATAPGCAGGPRMSTYDPNRLLADLMARSLRPRVLTTDMPGNARLYDGGCVFLEAIFESLSDGDARERGLALDS